MDRLKSYSGERSVVPEITFVRKAVTDEAKLAFLDVLFDWVEELIFGNLARVSLSSDDCLAVNVNSLSPQSTSIPLA